MVTSAQPLEGKTTTACNLALALAIGGARVLLIDADMRRSGVHRMLNIENGTGLSHVLTGQAPMADALVALENPKMWVMTAGMSPPNPSELLGSDQMRTLLDEAKNGRFDWVIIDSPPVLPVTDAVVLSPLVERYRLRRRIRDDPASAGGARARDRSRRAALGCSAPSSTAWT